MTSMLTPAITSARGFWMTIHRKPKHEKPELLSFFQSFRTTKKGYTSLQILFDKRAEIYITLISYFFIFNTWICFFAIE